MRVLICGAGAMGCLFGSLLTLAGEEVWLLSHWTEHLERIRNEGLTVHRLDGSTVHLRLPTVSYDEELPREMDIAFISVKSHATREAALRAVEALAPNGVAITMQNGLGNREVLASVVGEERAMLGVTAHGATLLGPAEVRHAGRGPTVIASEPRPGKAREIAELLTAAGIESEVEPTIERALWNKLLVNVGINALTALLRVRNGELVEHEPSVAVLVAAVNEAAAVARAKGIPVLEDPVARTMAVARATSGNVSSMLADVRRGVTTEIDVLNGAVVREGEALGIPTPVNETLTRLVKALEESYEARL